MIESSVEAQNRMEAVLTPEQARTKGTTARLRAGRDDVVANGRPASMDLQGFRQSK